MSKQGEAMRKKNRDRLKDVQYRGITISEYQDKKTRIANEIGRRKPYECCYGGITMIKAGGTDE